MIPTTVVLDANGFIRAAAGHAEASEWIGRIESRDVRARAPDLIHAEVANALLVQCRAGRLELDAASALLDILRRLPIRIMSLGDVAVPALRVGYERGLSAYDACYVVLAEQSGATLITADRKLAEATADSILIA